MSEAAGNRVKTVHPETSSAQSQPFGTRAWTTNKRVYVVFVTLLTLFNSVFDSTIPSGAIDVISAALGAPNETQTVLPTSVYLIGYVMGPLAFAPLSEVYGRKKVSVLSFGLFTIFTLASAVAPSWSPFILFRALCGVFASCPIAVSGGIFADIYSSPLARGRCMALSMLVTAAGPPFAPLVAGFLATVSWRWIFWMCLILAGISLVLVALAPETLHPAVARERKIQNRGNRVKVLTRPLYMIFFEPIVSFICLYLSYASGIFFMYFEAYPVIFKDIYGMSNGIAGLSFIPISVGALIGMIIFLSYDSILRSAKRRNAAWSEIDEYQRLPLACLGGPLYVIALFWLGWTSSPDIHWIVPMLAGVPFGMGFFLIFVALTNYLVDSYNQYAASAMAAASCSRSICGAVLPLAAVPMFRQLGVNWGCSLLGFLSLLMTLIPFIFIRYGPRLRLKSKFRHAQ